VAADRAFRVGRKRIARHALDLGVAIPIVRRSCAVDDQLPEPVDNQAMTILEEGHDLVFNIFNYVHGIGDPGLLPTLPQLNAWQAKADLIAYIVSLVDWAWLTDYVAILAPDEQLLVSVMVTTGERHTLRI
jgi:hypothetical protein